jgi:hypothetical protein
MFSEYQLQVGATYNWMFEEYLGDLLTSKMLIPGQGRSQW